LEAHVTDTAQVYQNAKTSLEARLGRKDLADWTDTQRSDAEYLLWTHFYGVQQSDRPGTADEGVRALVIWQFAKACVAAGIHQNGALPGHSDPGYQRALGSVLRTNEQNSRPRSTKAAPATAAKATGPAKKARGKKAPGKKTAKKAPHKAAPAASAPVPVTVVAEPAQPAPALATAPAASAPPVVEGKKGWRAKLGL
jgi:hypothetical protein